MSITPTDKRRTETKPTNVVDMPDAFYLGSRIAPDTRERFPDGAIYYDSSDLTTHSVILGMTGSGKSGLGITLLEEAALDGIPQIVIDPKVGMPEIWMDFENVMPQGLKGGK